MSHCACAEGLGLQLDARCKAASPVVLVQPTVIIMANNGGSMWIIWEKQRGSMWIMVDQCGSYGGLMMTKYASFNGFHDDH